MLTTDGLPRLADVIRTHGIAAKKSLGQNFILDLNLTSRIARLAAPLAGRTIVEVGPGPGGLTRALLAEGARPRSRGGARRSLPFSIGSGCRGLSRPAYRSPRRRAFHRLADPAARCSQAPAAIVANLPYGIATKLLVGWLEAEPWPPWFDLMVLMFQKEVAERIVAETGSKAYGRLAVIAQWRCEADITMSLPPEAFTPPPKVSSAVVTFRPRATPMPACSVKALGRVTAAAFGQRRKMLRQSLKSLTAMPELLLREANLDPELRAERLTVTEFANLAALVEAKGL